jgi:hypothetical protein
VTNQDIKQRAKDARVPLWRIADALGVCDMTLTRHMRYELPQTEKEKIFEIIDRLKTAVNQKEAQ